MATIEQRLQALEQENAARKQAEELLTISVRALVSKEVFEHLQQTIKSSDEQNGKLFNILIGQGMTHREKMEEIDGKIIGLQTEMRQRLAEQDHKITGLQSTQEEHTDLLRQILERLPPKP